MPAFGFAQQFQAPDYQTRAAAGLPVGPGLPDDDVSGLATQALAAPAPQQQPQQLQASRPSLWDIAQGVIFDGQSPAEAAMSARQRAYQAQTLQQLPALLSKLPPGVRAAALMGGPKVWDELAKNWSPQTRSAGQQTDYFGGAGSDGGRTNSTDTFGIDAPSGKGTQIGPGIGGLRVFGPSLGGDFKDSPGGGTFSARTGERGPQLPVKMAPAETLYGADGGAGPSPGPAAGRPPALDPAAFWNRFVLPHEGGFNPSDANGAPTNMGVNQSANPGLNVRGLTPEAAGKVFGQYFARSGAGALPAPLAAVHSDTYFISPKMAQSFLTQSGGDAQKYLGLRDAWMSRLEQSDPQKYGPYAKVWTQRNVDLGQFIGQLGGQGDAPGAGAPAGMHVLAHGSQPEPMSPGERQRWNIPTNDPRPYMMGADGKPAPISREISYGPKDTKDQRKDFFAGQEYQDYTNSVNAANAIEKLFGNFSKNNSVLDQATLDNGIRTMTGLSARNQNVVNFTEHLGVPDKLQGQITRVFGNGYLTPDVMLGIRDMIRGYADGHRQLAQYRLDNEAAFAKTNGQDFGVAALPDMLPKADVPYLQGRQQPRAQAGAPDPLSQARAAIAKGAPRDAVVSRLRAAGINPAGL